MGAPGRSAARPSRVAMVTGGGRGIGRALATGLAEHGCAVGLAGRTLDSLEQTAALCRDLGVHVATATMDVTDAASVAAAVASLRGQLGEIDLLVNNAGRADRDDLGFADADLGDVLDVIDVNLMGPLRVTHAVLPGMRAAGHGRVLNVNSGFAYRRGSSMTGYAVSKAALARTTDLLAHQLSADSVVVLDVSPGLVRTDMTESMQMWQRMADPPWGDPARIVAVCTEFADGRLDSLTGRFVHAGSDDLELLLEQLPRDRDARTMGLRTFGSADPLR